MASVQTAATMVLRVREELQLFTALAGTGTKQVTYRDGFSGDILDSDEPTTSILTRINQFMTRVAIDTGFKQDVFNITLVQGQDVYTLPDTVIRIISVYLGSNRLIRTTQTGLDSYYPSYRGDSQATPERYARLGTGNLLVAPIPPATPGTLKVRATTHVSDLTAITDTISGLPIAYQDLPIYGAALKMAVIDSENKYHQERKAFLVEECRSMLASLSALLDDEEMDDAAPLGLDEWWYAQVKESEVSPV